MLSNVLCEMTPTLMLRNMNHPGAHVLESCRLSVFSLFIKCRFIKGYQDNTQRKNMSTLYTEYSIQIQTNSNLTSLVHIRCSSVKITVLRQNISVGTKRITSKNTAATKGGATSQVIDPCFIRVKLLMLKSNLTSKNNFTSIFCISCVA